MANPQPLNPPNLEIEPMPKYYEIINTFHPPFPDVDSYLEAQQQGNRKSISITQETPDLLSRLPPELAALVFSNLSRVALDAARCLSWAWRMKIMSDPWILSAVLKPTAPLGEESPKDLHRRLLKNLDSSNAASLTFDHPDAWRIPFQERRFEFFIPPECKHHHPTTTYLSFFASVKICDSGDFIAFMISDPMISDPMLSLVFYRLGLSGQPLYVGSTPYCKFWTNPQPPSIIHMTSISCGQGWVLKVDMGSHVNCYLLEPRKAFAKDESPYNLHSFGSTGPQSQLPENRSEQKDKQVESITETLNHLFPEKYEFLASLPQFMSFRRNATVSLSAVGLCLKSHLHMISREFKLILAFTQNDTKNW